MTSRLQADIRLRPPRPPDLQTTFPPIRTTESGFISAKSERSVDTGKDDIDDRPQKRRKLEVQSLQESEIKSAVSTTLEHEEINTSKTGPKARVVHTFNAARVWSGGDDNTDGLPPLPQRPNTITTNAILENTKPVIRIRSDDPVPNTPDDIGFPKDVPHLGPNKYAGFFPWLGTHPEDSLSETHVKSGYFDRPPNPPEKELNTARLPLYNSLKNKNGIEGLSVLLSLVMQQKIKNNVGTSVSGFKPPPRVTLTEPKRKSWLSDLANVDVPLKRLSRTIPQGIRGQALLEQCLTNSVPLIRAIWFVKCVGANEIRSLKRKGTTPSLNSGTEAKWLREWTITVEQFMESTLNKQGDPTWKVDIRYVLRLAAQLYLEDLLDRDHFLDWILRSLAVGTEDQFPFWLLLCSMFRSDMLMFHKRAKRFVDILCERYKESVKTGMNILSEKVLIVLRQIATSAPRLFLMPDQWLDIRDIVQSSLKDVTNGEKLFQILERVNKRTMGFNRLMCEASKIASWQIFRALDNAIAPHRILAISDTLRQACVDNRLLVQSCVTWAISRCNVYEGRVYLVARLFRHWAKDGVEVQSAVLDQLHISQSSPHKCDAPAFMHLMIELCRSKTFSISHFMQWIMVRRHGDSQSSLFTPGINPIRLLSNLPLHNAPSHLINLRNALMEKSGYDQKKEKQEVNAAKSVLTLIFNEQSTKHTSTSGFGHLSWFIRCQISQAIRYEISHRLLKAKSQIRLQHQYVDVINIEQFSRLRNVLESLHDFAVLADVTVLLSGSQEESLLAALSDTVCRHFEIFSALGAFEFLHNRLCTAYLTIRVLKPIASLLTLSMQDLCQLSPSKSLSLRLLQQDLAKGESSRAIAACSPFSNGIAESLEQAGPSFLDDFEAILQSETHMNEQTMSSLMGIMQLRLEKEVTSKPMDLDLLTSLSHLMARLRLFRPVQAEALTIDWLRKSLRSTSSSSNILMSELISAGCMSIGSLYDAILSEDTVALTVRGFLSYLTDQSDEKSTATYRAESKFIKFAKENPIRVMQTLVGISEDNGLVTNLSAQIAVHESFHVTTSSTQSATLLGQTIDRLLGYTNQIPRPVDLVQKCDELSLPFIILRLRILNNDSDKQQAAPDHTELVDQLYCFIKSQEKTTTIPVEAFSKLLDAIGTDVVQELRKRVEIAIQNSLTTISRSKSVGGVLTPGVEDVAILTSQTSMMFRLSSTSNDTSPGLGVSLIEFLSHVLKTFGICNQPYVPQMPLSASGTISMESSPAIQRSFLEVVKLVLDLVCLKRPCYRNIPSVSSGTTKQMHLEQIRILVLVATVSTHSIWANIETIVTDEAVATQAKRLREFALDVLVTLADDLSDEARLFGMNLLKDKAKDPILHSLFGSINSSGSSLSRNAGHGLLLAKEGKGIVGPWKPKVWEILDNANGKEEEACLGLGLFDARRS